jgi:hypothetical protein
LSAGDTGTSGAIDLRYEAQRGKFAIQASVSVGTAGTCGTTIFSYLLSDYMNGTYVAPSLADTMGTFGTNAIEDFQSFTPILGPFMKVVATQFGSGTVGFDSIISSANLIVQ